MASGGAGVLTKPLSPEERAVMLEGMGPVNSLSLSKFDLSRYTHEIARDSLTPGNFYKINETLVTVDEGLSIKKYDGTDLSFDPRAFPVYSNLPSFDFSPYIYETTLDHLEEGRFYKLNNTLVTIVTKDGKKLTLKRFDGRELPFDPTLDPTIKFYSKRPRSLLEAVSKESMSDEVRKDAIRRISDGIEDLTLTNPKGETALMVAIQNGHWTIAAALIVGGANLQAKSNDGTNAYMYFCNNKYEGKGKDTVRVMFVSKGYKEGSCALQGGRRRTKKRKNNRKQKRRSTRK
jgi:hypothetical protein